ncbi:MgtC/SapB family protein [Paenibacillus sp. GCM10027628]|uniref:MgtC/SapB family protein n=1 Tax=Paenibacillus sp. GCM10027628 TaxID=3273413 RepID=UPI0036368DBC
MWYDPYIKLFIALLLGSLIGLDRQLKHKPLGLKTSMVISVASCLITIVSIGSVQVYSIPGHTNMDPLRLAAQIVSGVGFIGAGVILRRSNDVISGLTTAAMVWTASALGIATGAGFYKEALTTVVLVIAAVNLLPGSIKLLGPRKLSERDWSVTIVVPQIRDMTRLIDEIEEDGMRVKHIKINDVSEDKQKIQVVISASEKRRTTSIYYTLKQLNQVFSVEVESISS